MTIEWNHKNKSLYIGFCSPMYMFNYTATGRKYIDPIRTFHLFILFFEIAYYNLDANKICRVYLKSSDNYTQAANPNIDLIKKHLIERINDSYTDMFIGTYNCNYEVDSSGDYVFYITTTKKWLTENGVEELIPGPEWEGRNKMIEENSLKFPKYSRIVNRMEEI